MRKIFVPILVGLLVVEIITAIVIVAAQPDGAAVVFSGFGPEHSQAVAPQTFTTTAGAKLSVENGNGKVVVVGAPDTNQVIVKATKIVRGTSDKAFDKLVFEVKQNGNDIIVNGRQKDDWKSGLNGYRLDVEITVPAYILTSVNTSNGQISLSGLDNPQARHELGTSNGSINLAQVKAAQLKMRTSNGGIFMQEVAASVNSETSNGSIQASSSTLSLERVKSSNGLIDLGGSLKQTGDGSIETSNSSVTLRFAQTGEVRLDMDTSNGNIVYNKSGSSLRKSDKAMVIGTGGPTIKVRTSNGSIIVE